MSIVFSNLHPSARKRGREQSPHLLANHLRNCNRLQQTKNLVHHLQLPRQPSCGSTALVAPSETIGQHQRIITGLHGCTGAVTNPSSSVSTAGISGAGSHSSSSSFSSSSTGGLGSDDAAAYQQHSTSNANDTSTVAHIKQG